MRILLSKTFIIFCLLFVSFLTEAKKGSIEEKLEKVTIKFSSTLLDMEFFDAFNLSLDYYYKVQPAYVDGLFSRTDQLKVTLDVNPSDLLKGNSPIYLKVAKGNKLTFIRHFDSQKDAALELPKSFFINKIPTSAKRALKHINIGEFVSFKSDLRVVIGAQLATDQGWINVGGNTHYLISGEFEIRLFRINDNNYKLQLIALKKRGSVIDGKIKFLENLKITGFKFVKNRIEKIISLTLLDLGIESTREEIFLVDYDINMQDLDVQEAYDGIIQSFTNPKLSLYEKPFYFYLAQETDESLREIVNGNLIKMEKLYKREVRNKTPIDNRSVHRNFMGQNNSRTLLSRFRMNLKIFKFANDYIYRKNHLETYDENDEVQRFYLPTLSHFKEKSFFWDFNEEIEMISLNNLFSENEFGEVTDMLNSGFFYTYTDKNFKPSEQSRMQKDIMRLLPETVANDINWGLWEEHKTRINARVSYEVYFNKNSFKYLQDKSEIELEKMLYRYVRAKDIFTSSGRRFENYKHNCKWERLRRSRERSPEGEYAGAICYMAHNLHKVLNLGTNIYSIDEIKEVSQNEFFKEVVVGALIYELPKEKLEQLMFFKMRWSGSDAPTLLYKYGNLDEGLFGHIMNIQSILNNQSFDWKILESAMDKGSDEVQVLQAF